jgi:glycosyltransferase involved in cell wall biosynthesis
MSMSVSIVINNHDYASYLGAAIESALAQGDACCEVIAVDDGSTDDSRDVIAGYGTAVRPVLKEHGGQASALNAGFAFATGDIVIFLDADDVLAPDTVGRVITAFARVPSASKVTYRLEEIDVHGVPSGRFRPEGHVPLASGDLRQLVTRFPDDLAYPPMSGNAYAGAVLRRLFPIPVERYGQVYADVYLHNLTSLFGPVVALDGVGGGYRVHGRNHDYSAGLDLDRIRAVIRATRATQPLVADWALRLGIVDERRRARRPESVTFLAQCLISLKLGRSSHPIPADRPLFVAGRGVRASIRRTDVPVGMRLAYAGWFVVVLVAPRALARYVIERTWVSGRRSRAILGAARRQRVPRWATRR